MTHLDDWDMTGPVPKLLDAADDELGDPGPMPDDYSDPGDDIDGEEPGRRDPGRGSAEAARPACRVRGPLAGLCQSSELAVLFSGRMERRGGR